MQKLLILLASLFATVSAIIRVEPQKQCDVDDGGENSKCALDWTHFQRPSGGWCMKVFYADYLNGTEAESKCQEEKATLSGFQNPEEVLFVTNTSATHLKPITGSLWIGLKRIEKCLKSRVTANCTALNSFEWTDKSATGTDGILWNEGQPANYALAQPCAILATGYIPMLQKFEVGKFDDVGCEIRYNGTPRAIRGYVCGKKPTN